MHEAHDLRTGFDPPAETFGTEFQRIPNIAGRSSEIPPSPPLSPMQRPQFGLEDLKNVNPNQRNTKSGGEEALALKAHGFAACELTEITKLIGHLQPAKSSFTAHFCLILSKRNSNSNRICTIGSF